MPAYIPIDLRTQVEQADRSRCCYCSTQTVNSGIPLSFDHILLRSKGGETVFEKVCLACRSCNEFKSDQIEATDPLTGETALLFNPRQQCWTHHSAGSAGGTRVEGLTPMG